MYSLHHKATQWVAFVLLLLITPSMVLSASTNQDQATEPSSRLYLALADEYDRPLSFEKNAFDCSEKIFAVAELKHFTYGKHEFSVQWIDPANITREHTRYPFHINQDQTRLWSWLSLRRGAGASMLQWLDPSAGLEEFIGPWTVQVHIDGKKLAEMTMEVNC